MVARVGNRKWCPKCETMKDVAAFANNRTTSDGLQYHCRACMSAALKRYRRRAAAPVEQLAKVDSEAANAAALREMRRNREEILSR